MAVVSVEAMLDAEQAAIANGWSESSLMDIAGEALGHAIGRHFPQPGTVIGYLGKGHNAGDTLIALRVLNAHYGWDILYRPAWSIPDCASLVQHHASRLDRACIATHCPDPSRMKIPLLLIDGLLGTGAKGAIRGPALALAAEMHQLRDRHGARIAAVDIPSGVDADTGAASPGAVIADVTFMIGNAKQGLASEKAATHTGSLALVPLPPLSLPSPTAIEIISPQTANFGKGHRPHHLHKGSAGKVGLIVGGHEYPGAAALAATGALRSGAGLVTVHVPTPAKESVAAKCPPEVIVLGYNRMQDIAHDQAAAWVVGCGLGMLEHDGAEDLFNWLTNLQHPAVIDADALNLIARHERHDLLRANHVITPHPGEYKRLAAEPADSREQAARHFTTAYPAVLLLKGTRSIITQAGIPLWINTTGTSGMASGGMGDLLAGAIGSWLAAGLAPWEAAALGAWTAGRAGERAAHGQVSLSPESLTASDAAMHLGAAIRDWQQSAR